MWSVGAGMCWGLLLLWCVAVAARFVDAAAAAAGPAAAELCSILAVDPTSIGAVCAV